MPFSATEPPSSEDLAAARELRVFNERGDQVRLGDLFDNKQGEGGKAVQDYVSYLTSTLPPTLLVQHNVTLSIVGCGDWKLAAPYRQTLGTPFQVYADPTKKSYEKLGMTLRTLDMGSTKPEYQREGMFMNALTSIFRVFSVFKTPLGAGDSKQLGGEFVFSAGQPIYVHRMENTRGHAPLDELLKAMGISAEEVKKAAA
ncbi:hypothetical protein JCM11251_001585 [Rhodosporidiobolus azoricus]